MEDNSVMVNITTKEGLIDLFMRMDNGSYEITDEELLPILCEWGKKALDEKDPHLASLIRSHAKSYNSPDSRLGRGDAFIYSQLSKYVPGLIGYSDLREKIRDVVNAGSENYDVWLECLAEYFSAAGVGKVLNFWEEIDEMHLDDDRKKKLREAFWENIVENPALQSVLVVELRNNKPLYTTLCKFADDNKYTMPSRFSRKEMKLSKKIMRKEGIKYKFLGMRYKLGLDGLAVTTIISLVAIALCFFFRYLPFVKPVIVNSTDTTIAINQMNTQYITDLASSEYESSTSASGTVKTIFTTSIYNNSGKTLKNFSYKVTFYDSEQNKIISKRYKISEPVAPNETKVFTNELEHVSSTGATVSSIKVGAAKFGFERSLKLGWQIVIAAALNILLGLLLDKFDSEPIFGMIATVLNVCLYLLFATNYIYIFLLLLPMIFYLIYSTMFDYGDVPVVGVITILISIAPVVFHVLRFFM